MADKKQGDRSPEENVVPVRYPAFASPGVFAQQAVLQADKNSLFLNFYQLSSPLMMGDIHQRDEVIKKISHVDAKPVVQVIMPISQVTGLIDALQSQADQLQMKRDGDKKAHEDERE